MVVEEEFYSDPYSFIDDACDAIMVSDWKQAQAQALTAIAIILLGFSDRDDGVPASPIPYDEYGDADRR